jgi:hypothetical protein
MTINACESFHAHFGALFYSAHHNIFVLSALQKVQNETYIKMRTSLHKDLKISYSKKKRTSSPQKFNSIGIT